MVPVRVEGVRRNFRQSSVFMYTVTLVEEGGPRIFNAGIERHEALPIVAALHHLSVPRPPTLHVLVDTLVLYYGIALAAIQLDDLRPSPIHLITATLRWRDAGGRDRNQQRNLRPGDAIGLGLLTGCPHLLADALARRLGVTLAEGQTPETYLLDDLLRREGLVLRAGERLRLGHSKTPLRDALVAELRLNLAAKAAPLPEEDQARRKRDILAFVTRDGAATVAAPWARTAGDRAAMDAWRNM